KRNVSYHEYLQFKENTKTEKRKLKISVHMGIQKKIVFSFVLIIFFLIFSLSYIMLQEYRESILNTVLHNGTTLAERSASFVDVNLGDSINIKDYFTQENKSNKVSSFPYNSMTYYGWSKADNTYLALFGTDPDIIRDPISGYLKDSLVSGSRYIPGNKTYEFHSPIYMQDKRIGYVVVIYDEVIIYSSYFNTQVRILLFSLFFIYVAIILIYIFGTQITFPILFLGMSVNKLTNNLSHMIKGELAVNREHLNYNDIVKTNDEIKTLSTEIKDMAGVIQGVIPYISSSTFRSVEKGSHSKLKDMAFLFTDIRGFTTLCEGMSPDAVVEILNYYLDLQSNIILKHHGDIDKFVGDEIMASFDGEDKELNACLAAIEIRKAMAEDRELKSHIKEKTVSIGIGINTGSVVFGSVGAKERMDYTSIGDTVNLAARLEGANKQYGTKSLISGSVYNQVKDKFLCREIDLMTVKGKKKAVRIYEILQEKSKANKKLLEIKKNFETGLQLYRKKSWDEAESFFNKNLEIFKDIPSEVFLDRISLFRKNPPPEKWNGVFNLLVK
ncbi:MAG: adenylate/guanylate cyclase domain-containing protein, partial [Deltaproteobacteria bacterium]|nr:adenylate/guanylate cyclase domain-containing protein [Deltaproteobacteria bacterium]